MTENLITSTRPFPGPPRPYRFPSFTRHTLANGVRLIVATVPRVPLVSLHVVVNRGAIHENAESAGVSLLMARALAEGTRAITGADLAERFETLGGGLDADAQWDSVEWATTTRAASSDSAVELLALILREPACRQEDVERLRSERLAELLEQRAEPRGLADDAFSACVYQAGSRLALPLGGDATCVSRLTAESVKAWHRRVVRPQSTTLIVVGDISVSAVLDSAARTLSSWSVNDEGFPASAWNQAEMQTGIHLVARPGSEQTELRIGHSGPPRRSTEYFDLVVMNAILGGLFSSRINLNLREQHGYTYGAWSAFDWRREGSTFSVSTAVRLDATLPAIREILGEIDRMRRDVVSDAELSLAVDYLEGVFPIRYETTAALSDALATLVAFGLPDDYFDCYRPAIRAVSRESVLRAAQNFLTPEHLRIALVSGPAMEEELTSLGRGEVKVTPVNEGDT